MISRLENGRRVAGINQCRKAVKKGTAAVMFIAEDVEDRIKQSLLELCAEHGVDVVSVPTMGELGRACGIEVGTSAAVLLK
jgi:large subunit ribosomal protein L7A